MSNTIENALDSVGLKHLWSKIKARFEKVEKAQSDTAQLEALIETDMLPAVHDADGKILTDAKGKILLRY